MNNSTDSSVLLDTTTPPNYDQWTTSSDVEKTFFERLLENWYQLFCHILGMFLSLLVICFSLFNKRYVNGDYKWFVMSQAVACFLWSFCQFVPLLVINCAFGVNQFYSIYFSSGCPLWVTLFYEILIYEVQMKLGDYAQMITLFATVFNRWLAITFPHLYSIIMKPRLIIIYCILCFVIALFNDWRLYGRLSLSNDLKTVIMQCFLLIPWISSAVLNAIVFVKLLKHQRTMTNVIDQRRIKESRSIVVSVFIQTLIHLLDKLPTYSRSLFIGGLHFYTAEEYDNSWIGEFLLQINAITFFLIPAFTCLTILLTMRPYRQALFSTFSQRAKCLKRFPKQPSSNKISAQTVTITRTPVISIRSVASNNNVAIVVPS